jgi:hypothetical protein
MGPASGFDAALADPEAILGSGFRGRIRGCLVGWSLKGCTISTRPLAPFQGSRDFVRVVSTGGGRVLTRLARSDCFFVLSWPPLTET